MAFYRLTVDANGGTVGDAYFYYNTADGKCYDASLKNVITSIKLPTRELYRCTGLVFRGVYYDENVVDSYGNLLNWDPQGSNRWITANWEQISYKVTLNSNKTGVGNSAFFVSVDNTDKTYYKDYLMSNPITAVDMPTADGFLPTGYYTATSGGTLVINADGTIVPNLTITSNRIYYARWSASPTISVSFEPRGGSIVESKILTLGAIIRDLPKSVKNGAIFGGWELSSGVLLKEGEVSNFDSDIVAYAVWVESFNGVIDYFGMANENLIPITSSSGDNQKHLSVAHIGIYEKDVGETSGIWRNPTVSYEVVGDVTVNGVLGKSWKGEGSISGYMLVSAQVSTRIGKFPIVTIKGQANEGVDAINLFPFSIPVKARAKAQNLANILVGGEIQEMSLRAECVGVVVEENMMPCASDVVKGRLVASAKVLDLFGEGEPLVGEGFVTTNLTLTQNRKDYKAYDIVAEKEIN